MFVSNDIHILIKLGEIVLFVIPCDFKMTIKRGDSNFKMNQNKKFDMICPQKLNTVNV